MDEVGEGLVVDGSRATHIRRRGRPLQIRLNRAILLIELRKIRHEILNHIRMRQRIDPGRLLRIRRDATQTSQRVDPVNVHRARPADALPAAPPERQRRVDLVLDPDQRVQHHGAGFVQVERVGLHPWLLGRLVGVPAVDVEGLDLGAFLGGGLFDCGGLGFRDYGRALGGCFAEAADGVDGGEAALPDG